MKQMHKIFSGLLTVISITVWSQGTVFTKATRNEQMNHFVDASDAYQGLYVRGDREASLLAARNLYKARRYEEALPLFEFADSLKIITDAEQVFAFFECLKSVKRYEEADLLVKARLGEFAGRPEFGLHHEKLEFYKNISSYKGAELKLLALNSKFSEISPTVYNGWLYFVSTRPATGNHTVHRINMQPFYNLYGTPADKGGPEVADPKGDFGKASQKISLGDNKAASLPEGINKKFHDGPVNVTPSGKYMFFTTNHFEGRKAKDVVNLMIYYSENKDGVWQTPQALPSNSVEYSNQHGFFDEGTSTLYFASNRAGGQGGWDIWKSKMESNGNWSESVNLGSGVNTVKTEVFPSLSPDGTLIFASNGWPGLGGLDLFVTQPGGDPLNLLAGVNSEKDDFGLVFSGKEGGYLVSNRGGGAGDDDIYAFTMKYDLSEIKKYNRYEVPVEFTLKDNASGNKIAVAQAKLVRDGVENPLTVKDGATTGLMAGDVVTLNADGYKPVTLTVTEAMLESGKVTTGFDAVPKAVESVVLNVKDAETGAVVAAQFSMNGNPADLSTGTTAMKAGDLIRVSAPGYIPAEVLVTSEMLKTGASDVALTKENAGDTRLMVSAASPDGSGIPAQVTVNRAQNRQPQRYSLNLPQGGESIPVATGDELVFSGEGYAVSRLVVTKEMVKAGKVSAKMKEAAGVPAATTYPPVYFDYREWSLLPASKKVLDRLIRDMNANPSMKVEIRAYTDCRGDISSNMQLSRVRLNSVLEYLRAGIGDSDRVSGEGYGESILVNDCGCEGAVRSSCTDSSHRLNRRAEIAIRNITKN